MDWTVVRTKSDLDEAIAKGSGNLHFEASMSISLTKGRWTIRAAIGFKASVEARGNSSVVARENSSVEAWENSSVVARENSSVEAWENSSVVARENSSVVAWENSSVVARGNSSVVARGNSSVVARENSSVVARGNSSVVAWGNSSVVAWENSSVEAWENSSVEARENSSVVARENSSVVAWGNVFVRLFAALKIKASAHVVVMRHGPAKSLEGGRVLDANKPSTAAGWCDHYGVAVADGVATLYKAVDDDYSTWRAREAKITYSPGTLPIAPDWDGGQMECGGGLHASPHPKMALEFNGSAKRFVACYVKLEDISVHPDGQYPKKVKFRGCCAPCEEVDRNGNPVTVAQSISE